MAENDYNTSSLVYGSYLVSLVLSLEILKWTVEKTT
jgi:hypothetical protein